MNINDREPTHIQHEQCERITTTVCIFMGFNEATKSALA